MASRRLALAIATLLLSPPAAPHHSYALFDTSRALTVQGTAAKFEWMNPHVFVWMYVPDRTQPGGFRLFAFESGSMVVMARDGWNRNTVGNGEKLTVEYFPLKDGRPGGSLIQVKHADGHVNKGDPYGQRVIEQMRAAAGAGK